MVELHAGEVEASTLEDLLDQQALQEEEEEASISGELLGSWPMVKKMILGFLEAAVPNMELLQLLHIVS